MTASSTNIRVLHVDDEPDLTEVVAESLEREDERFVVETANSVERGLERLDRGGIDCVVSDYEMPGADGIQFLEAVREQHPELPFVLYTGTGSEEVASDAISAGVTDYLQKGGSSHQYTVLANRVGNAVERYRSQRALARRNDELRRYERMVDSMNEAACIYDAEGRFELVNDHLADWYGTTPAELEGRESALIPHIRADADGDPYRELLAGEREEIKGVAESEFPGHGTAVLEYRLTPLVADGGVESAVGVARDVTERRARERKLTALHDVADELATSGSVEEVCERTITASREILEFDLSVFNIEEDGVLVVRAVSEGIQPEGMADMPVDEGIAGKTYRTGESVLAADVTDHGEAKPQAAYRSAISVPVGEYGVFQAVAEEAGAFDEADLELAELLTSHARAALERLDHERELERQNERLEEFASVVSHDLRNPLAVATGRLELTREECDSDHLDAVADAHDRMDTLIGDLLRVAREGERVQATEPVALDGFAETCWQGLATADATLRVETDRTVRAQRSRLKQLFENLFVNAVDHGGDGVTVTVGALDGGFYVADDGPGIPADERDAVFEAGYSTAPEGTGFGLSIVRQVADAHGWTVRVAESDGGARFEVTGVEVVE